MFKPFATKPFSLDRHLLIGASALAMLLAAPASAQVDADEDIAADLAATDEIAPGARVDLIGDDEIVVTGIRSGIADALRIKRDANSIVEAISAEDIGRLPDVSIADSLARLPGVTAQRVRGRAQGISIRGLGPDFSIALLNGREIVSAGNNRGIEFDQFPSELIGQAVVYKSPTARLAATGIAGTVDLRTVRPLDTVSAGDEQLTLTGRYVINDNGQLNPDFSDDGYRLFGAVSAVNDSDTAGFTLAVTTQSTPTQFLSRELKTNQFQVGQDDNGVFFANDNPRSGAVSRDFERTSIAGTLQFEPTDRFRASADVLYTDFSDSGIFRGVETPLASWSGNSATDIQGTPGEFATSATYPLTPVILRTDTESNDVESSAFGVNLQYDLTDRFTVEADFSTSSLDRNDIDYESYAGTGRGIVGSGDTDLLSALTYNTPSNGEYSVTDSRGIDYTSPGVVQLTDPGGWGQVGFIREPVVEDDLDQIRLEASYGFDETPFLSGISVGAIFTDREKSFDDNPRFLRPGLGFVDSSRAINPGIIVGQTDTDSLGLDIIAYDPSGLLSDGTYIQEDADANVFQIEEQVDSYYAIVELDGDLGNIPFTGNFGLKYIDTDQSSTGLIPTATGRQFQTVGDSYGDFLPSVNLNFEVLDQTNLRLGYARTQTRPLFNDLAANFSFDFDNNVCSDTTGDQVPDTLLQEVDPPQFVCFSSGGGNPLLRPYTSDAFDISGEKYFGASSAIIVAGFYKDLSDYVFGSTDFVDGTPLIQGFGAGSFLAANPSVSTIRVGGPVNTESGELYGFEAQVRLALADMIDAGALEGFGFNGSLGITRATLETDDGADGVIDINIPGFSEETAQGELYYERNGIRARVSANYRSDYQANIFAFDGSAFGARALGRTTFDAQIGYEFQNDSGPLKDVFINVEAFNFTDTPFRTEEDFSGNGDTFVSRREDFGRTFNFTVSKTF